MTILNRGDMVSALDGTPFVCMGGMLIEHKRIDSELRFSKVIVWLRPTGLEKLLGLEANTSNDFELTPVNEPDLLNGMAITQGFMPDIDIEIAKEHLSSLCVMMGWRFVASREIYKTVEI